MEKAGISLLESFDTHIDPRIDRHKRHSLQNILVVGICSVIPAPIHLEEFLPAFLPPNFKYVLTAGFNLSTQLFPRKLFRLMERLYDGHLIELQTSRQVWSWDSLKWMGNLMRLLQFRNC